MHRSENNKVNEKHSWSRIEKDLDCKRPQLSLLGRGYQPQTGTTQVYK